MRPQGFLPLLLVLLLAGCSEPDRPTVELYLAVHRGDINQIERHIHWGSDINAIDADGRTPLHVAARQGQTAVVNLLLKNGAEINVVDRQGYAALHDALLAKRIQIADLLLKKGATLDVQKLLWSVVDAGLGDRGVLQWLAKHGADFNAVNVTGMTPLAKAIVDNQRSLVKFLVAQGADVNRTDAQGRLPLQLASSLQDQFIFRLLQKHGARME